MQTPFEHAVERHGVTVLRVCRAVLGPSDAADDAWSETFLSALQAWPALDDDANVEGWLVTIAHRKAIDVIRARSRHAVPVDSMPASPRSVRGLPATSQDPADDPLLHPHDDLWTAVAALPPRQRDAVTLHHVAGLPHAEVAALVGSTSTAVRRASSDGIASLRRTLDASPKPPSDDQPGSGQPDPARTEKQ